MTNDPWSNPTAETVTTPAQKDAVVQAFGDAPIVNTIKHGSGYDAPWTVIRSNTPSEFNAFVDDPEFGKMLEKVVNISKYAQKVWGGPTVAANNTQQQPNTAAPAGASEGPGPAPTCNHGAMIWKAGISQAGKAYKLWSCTAPRDQQCKAVYPN